MEGTRFDELARSVAGISRRRLLGRVAGAAAAGMLAQIGLPGSAGATCPNGSPPCGADCCDAQTNEVCQNGRCCGGEVAICNGPGQCCHGLVCFEGRCQVCAPGGAACVFDAQCCPEHVCVNPTGVGGACCPSGQACGPLCCPEGTIGVHCSGRRPRCRRRRLGI
jgi:hypothetical protein